MSIITEAHAQKCKAVPVHYTKVRCGVEVELHSLLTTALDGIECSPPYCNSFISKKYSPYTLIGGWTRKAVCTFKWRVQRR